MAINKSIACCLVTLTCSSVVSGIFFTSSKENDFPRIGKRCQNNADFYNSLLCRNFRNDVNRRDKSSLGFPDLRPKLGTDMRTTLNADFEGHDTSEDIFKPRNAKPFRIPQHQNWVQHIKAYLKVIEDLDS